MEFVAETPHGRGDLTLAGHDSTTSLAEVIERITGVAPPPVVFVDGCPVPVATTLAAAGMRTGSLLSLDCFADEAVAAADRCGSEGGAVELVQVAGPGSGHRRLLGPGRYTVGEGRRSEAGDLQVAAVGRPAFELGVESSGACRVAPVDGGAGGVEIDGISVTATAPLTPSDTLVVADRAFVIVHPGDHWRPRSLPVAGDGRVPFNRPPRRATPAAAVPLDVPDGQRVGRERRRFPLVALLAPIPLAAAMAIVLGRPMMLLFGLLSPVMMLANWLEERRDERRQRVAARRADAAAEAEFRQLVRRAHAAERLRLRSAHPDIATLIDRARSRSARLWERRADSPDAWQIPIGLGDLSWTPELRTGAATISVAGEIVAAAGCLAAVPVVVDVSAGRGVGIVGTRRAALPVARGLLLAASTIHGPADLRIVVCTDRQHAADWDWAKWLPHTRVDGAVPILTTGAEVARWAGDVAGGRPRAGSANTTSPLTLVIADVVEWWHDRHAPLRGLVGDARLPFRFVTITDRQQAVPAPLTTVIDARSTRIVVEDLVAEQRTEALPFAVDNDLALVTALALAPLEDSDLGESADVGLPERQPLLELLGLGEPSPSAVTERWRAGGTAPRPRATLGITRHGPLVVDLVEDGPHGLVAGTTGAGKSELLRSLVVSMAASLSPDHLNVVLVDFKGGSAFDACADLPHTVGVVTDLDEHLGGRVLRCLRAELRHREQVLRAAGVASLDEHQLLDDVDPMPRLVVIVDEFASVATELPTFIPSLIDVAQRGRSLGIHLILATQRPAGVVDAKIKANTNLRIALRVQDDGDSVDVIGGREAASLPRQVPGRGYARFGAGEVIPFQSAYATGASPGTGRQRLVVAPWCCGRPPSPVETCVGAHGSSSDGSGSPAGDRRSDLERLVAAAGRAAADLGLRRPRRPCPDPLPSLLPIDDLLADHPGGGVPLGLVDLPDEQRQEVRSWRPGPDGSLLVYGISGAGTSSLLASLALGIAGRWSPDDVHLYVIDADANLLDPVGELPHCGGVVPVDDLGRVGRLLRTLTEEVTRRKSQAIEAGGPAAVARDEPAIVLLVDNVGALRQALEADRHAAAAWNELECVIRDGQSLGLCTVVTAKHDRAIPLTIAGQFRHRLVMQLADTLAYSSFGFRAAEVPRFVPGRALDPAAHAEMQLACPPAELAAAVAGAGQRWGDGRRRPPRRVDPLPSAVPLCAVLDAARCTTDGVALPIGLDTVTAAPALLRIDDGATVFVAGPARSGRSTVLEVIAIGALTAEPDIAVYAVCPRGGPLAGADGLAAVASRPADVASLVEQAITSPGRRMVVIDDADRLGGPSLERLAHHGDDSLCVVVAGRSDDLRAIGHWSRPLQPARSGVLLRPTPIDGELLRTSLPLHLPRFDVGHGFLVDDGRAIPLLAAYSGGAP